MENEERTEIELVRKAALRGGGLDVSLGEFERLLRVGGRMTSANESGPDRCYIHRLSYRDNYFKTITVMPYEFGG